MSMVKEVISAFPFNNRKLLLACSGGVDSMVLLHALVNAGHRPVVLHVNYHLRGNDSDLDQQLVEKTAAEYGLEYHVHHCPVELTTAKGVNLQAAARDFRRKLFKEWIAKGEDHAIVLAHHGDDQIETFFLQYFRGSGSLGLGGMYEDKSDVLRPLLGLFRKDILNYAQEQQVNWREDVSNKGTKYLRNLFRNKLLPHLSAENPDLKESVLFLMKQFREQRSNTETGLRELSETWRKENKIRLESWNSLEQEEKLTFLSLCGLPVWLNERIPELNGESSDQKLLTDNWIMVRRANDLLAFARPVAETWEFKMEKIEILPDVFLKDELYLDGDRITADDILIRMPATGDKIKSLGMQGSQLVSDVLKDAGIPSWERRFIPVVVIKNQIAWIPGVKIGRQFLAGKATENKVKLTVFRAG